MDVERELAVETVKMTLGAAITIALGYVLAAFRKASKEDVRNLEDRVEAKFRERQAFIIDPLKASIANLESKLTDCITARELDAKFTALERRLDDILAMIRKEP